VKAPRHRDDDEVQKEADQGGTEAVMASFRYVQRKRPEGRRGRRQFRPEVLGLEARQLLTNYTLSTLASFNGTGTNGSWPLFGVVLDGQGNLYGTTEFGGASGGGTVFEIASGSHTITTLASFNGTNGPSGLVVDGHGNLYGVTEFGGAYGNGQVFEIASGSHTITTLASFINDTNGSAVPGGLVVDGHGNLYGTTENGGTENDGTVFEIASGSNTVTTLASFNGTGELNPIGGLVLDGQGNLYGTAFDGASENDGTVFEIASGSNTVTTLASFNGTNPTLAGGLVLDGQGNLYGATETGQAGDGTVFEIASGSHTITTLASFNDFQGSYAGGLVLDSQGNLYGTTDGGGANGDSTVFEIASGSHTITTLASFNYAGGSYPVGLVLDGRGNLYGTIEFGGTENKGSVFELSPTPAFSGLNSQSVTYGTPSVQLSGTIEAGSQVPTGSVTVSAGGATATAPIDPSTGSFTINLTTSSLTASATPYPVTYSYAGAGNFAAVQDSSTSITVAQAQLTVTASNASRAFGVANPTFADHITGFVDGQTLATSGVTGLPSLATTAVSSSPAGTYPITVAAGTLAATNYDFAFANGTLTVTPPTHTSGAFVVTNTNDSGIGSLRQALTNANNDPGLDTITFDIPGPGVHTINPATPLPAITDSVVIDGYSQPGASPNSLLVGDNAVPLIQIDGSLLLGSGVPNDGLDVKTNNSVISGLVIVHFGGTAIQVGGTGNTIEGNFLGTDPTGAVAQGNMGPAAVLLQEFVSGTVVSNNTIGGSTPAARNLISGNSGDGVEIDTASGTGNVIQGNYIGTDASGTTAVANGLDGILLTDAATDSISGNLISGNGSAGEAAGINIQNANSTGNTISGNLIGTNATGTSAVGNSLHGVFVGNGASHNVIGPGNVISGNGGPLVQGVGVYVDGTATQSNSVIGNFIGTTADGKSGIPAGSSVGVLINDAPNNTIGGVNLADRNIISGNSVDGVYIALAGATGNVVQNNYIGTDVSGLAGIPSDGADGIYINGAPGNTIGGTVPGTGNLISANQSAGIDIYGAGATNNRIFQNQIGLDANGQPTLPNKLNGIVSQISIQANDFGVSIANRNLGQAVPSQYSSSIGGGTVSGTSQAAVAAHRKVSHARRVSGPHGPLSKRKAAIATGHHRKGAARHSVRT
jgi:uncharacterized repeat protein (TIGR03803 family)